ncbi:tripartite tricarboxylate transporter substrate binding protein [Verticiella sediminum]|uniref:Tripartite tricarboxylate transporter substrate binding protein n=1 Tax=Verticiella sediminum TaxID=1247510 RepID=A0A556AB35_9BURK|nr:tripartite tricarboxylate transporter substrate binding protein [Verticiella sediminum]TSH90105.1 tripartite tricarboxylate transporter substrate binding protein [Verticiella sediminum]
MYRFHLRRALCATIAVLALPWAQAQTPGEGPWPQRPIRWIVPYMAGTAPDTSARVYAEVIGKQLGQPIIVENRGGAGGNIGAQMVARAQPDGYTWVSSAGPMAANMYMYRHPGYDALKDFTHVTRTSESDVLLVVDPRLGIRTVADLIAYAKAHPGKLNYASGGVGTPSHLGMEMFLKRAGIHATHVPYKGAGESINAVMGSQVDMAMPIFGVAAPQVEGGRLVALAVANTQRNSLLPDVPTLAEQGVAGVTLTSWGGLSVPAGTPPEIVERMRKAAHQAMQSPLVKETSRTTGSRIAPSSGEEYVQLFKQEMALTREMMQTLDLEPQ